jgi:hypothetical protein
LKELIRKNLLWGTACVALGAGCAWGFTSYFHEKERTAELEQQLEELSQKEHRAVIDQSINRQMEEIAYEQKRISDERTEEAKKQAEIAEEEKQNAIIAQNQARASEEMARKERDNAEAQSKEAKRQAEIANDQRKTAEFNKRVADTLNYIALGRSLASIAYNQYLSGNNKELAKRLAYTSYWFTKTYGSINDLYHLSVIQTMMEVSESKHSWNRLHKGGITGISFMPGTQNELVSVSSYGEIFRHVNLNGKLNTQSLFANSNYDFRSVYIDKAATIFAASYTGQLIIIPANGKPEQVMLTDITHPVALDLFNDDILAVIGERSVVFFNTKTHEQQGILHTNAKITATGRINKHPFIFDELGYMHEIVSLSKMETKRKPSGVKGIVTAFARSDNKGINTYGTSDGKIYVEENNGRIKELVGHRSRITRLKVNGSQLYSSSYDGKMNLWLYENEKIEPIQLFQSDEADGWIRYFNIDNKKTHLWLGDNNGNLTETLISVDVMVKRLKGHLLTEEQWNNYIGKSATYQMFLNSEKGGGK